MKKIITISLLLCCFYMAGYAQGTTDPPKIPTPVLTGSQSVDCIQTNTSLELSFNQSLGEIKIDVWGGKKVYSKTTPAFSDTKLIIPTSGWANINHSVCITDRNGMVIATFTVSIQN